MRSPPRGAVAVGIKRSIDTRGAIPGLRGAAAMATLKKRLDFSAMPAAWVTVTTAWVSFWRGFKRKVRLSVAAFLRRVWRDGA